MPAQKTRAALSHMLDPLSEDELDQTTTLENTMESTGIENLNPVPSSRQKSGAKSKASTSNKTTSTKAAASKVTKAKAPARRASGGRKTTGSKRKALAERVAPNESDTEEVEDFEEEATEVPVKRKARRKVEVDAEEEEAPKPAKRERARAPKSSSNATSRGKKSKREPSTEPQPHRLIPETQPDPMDIEPSIDEVTEIPIEPAPTRAVPCAPSRSRDVRHTSMVRQPSVPRSRAGSVSDPERRTHDPALRRKLGEITKKFENLDLKYKQLKDIGTRDAESNFEKLRKSTEQRAKDQDDVIASLKKELAAIRANQSESKSMRSKITAIDIENQRLMTENARLTSESKSQTSSLTDAQNEIKSLNARLSTTQTKLLAAEKAAEKAAETAAASVKIPGSAVKGAQKNLASANANLNALNADMAVLKLKEELYSDLTGLMVRNVKKVDGEDVFDCIQTGRNGTLHFHLSVPQIPTGTDGAANFDEVEFAYIPLLDEKNDQALIDVLPDYLTEEICFPRNAAAKFYAKVLDSMSKKVVVEE
ncbi:hypothetical protein NA57DRAFT_75730 [Rhizodiscina lignyota]|uniref:Monopolin complex subunit Csm1/Pcs1 C-terminal domain-containing protein n=1 Tax=Rhizodiscina lignyota TaxID=1504668 RepID=A0A9P4M633_9PEZI|nr:hypothetical protein NA57DRAFT_75730 [Rhizodiscina lignyota]